MIQTIGLVEFDSIAQGVRAADEMVKAAQVELILSTTICPGKYIVLVSGDVGAVQSSVKKGINAGQEFIVDQLIINRVAPQLIKAINGVTQIEKTKALGIIEYYSVATAIVGADSAAKAAQVDLINVRLALGVGGKSFVTLTGDVSAVEKSVEAGAQVGEENGLLLNKTVISAPSEELDDHLL